MLGQVLHTISRKGGGFPVVDFDIAIRESELQGKAQCQNSLPGFLIEKPADILSAGGEQRIISGIPA